MAIPHEEHIILSGIIPSIISLVKMQNSGVSIIAVAYGGGSRCCCCIDLEKCVLFDTV